MPRMTAEEIDAFLISVDFPGAREFATIETITDRELTLRMPFRPAYVRPGGTVSGPALMTLTDTAAFFLILAMQGPLALAVTSSLDIHFLAKPKQADVIATARMLKLGKRLAVTAVELRSDGESELVAHATVTYALPQR